MKIAVYGICLNEAQFVDRFMDACRDADVVVIADTGSTDDTVARFRDRGALVHQIKIDPWRFDAARNAALALVPSDVDVCISLDIDEVISPDWRECIEAHWTPDTTRGQYMMVCSYLADGSPGTQFINSRIHGRYGYTWRHICHEGIYPDNITEKYVFLPEIRVDHFPDNEKSRGNYLPMLERAARAEPFDSRMSHYLAREYYYYGQWKEAIAEFDRYLAMRGDPFPHERIATLLMMATCQRNLGEDAFPTLCRALAEGPNFREPWIAMSEYHYTRQDWPNCYAAAVKGLSIMMENDGYPRDPYYLGATPHDLAALGAWNIGLSAEAVKHVREAARLAPDDERIRKNVEIMEQGI
jgi:glycosyltransferase involved in cell wall biosynthesis